MEDNTSGSLQLNGRDIPKNNPNGFAVPSDAKHIRYFPYLNKERPTLSLRTAHTSHVLHVL